MAPSLALTLVLLCAAASAARADGEYVFANTTTGTVRGVVANGTHVFKGIPYAASAAGANRWLPPQPLAPWSGVRDALAFGPGCIQDHHNLDTPEPQSEDCLSLNVWSPASPPPPHGWPVMLWIHGGAFLEGGSSVFFYDASYLCNSSNTVVVTINYRLGSLGFLTTDSLGGNFGLMDQRAAMQWARANIANFGGDPTRLTVFGESAGAMSVGLHLVSPLSAGLFDVAIMESNPAAWRYKNQSSGAVMGNAFAKLLGCADGNDLVCMRNASVDQVKEAEGKAPGEVLNWLGENWGYWIDGFLPWTPTVDGSNVPDQLLDALATGRFAHVPVLIGTNQNEGVPFVYGAVSKPVDELEVLAFMAVLFGARNTELVAPFYNFSGDARVGLAEVITDYLFRCPSRRVAELVAAGGEPTHLYKYQHVLSFNPFGDDLSYCANYTCHAAEIPMVFHVTAYGNMSMNAQELALAAAFGQFWTSTASDGSPSGPASWPPLAPGSVPMLNLQTPAPVLLDATNDKACAAWDKVGYDH